MTLPGDALRLAVGTLTVLPVPPPRATGRRVAALAMVLAPVAALPLAAGTGLVVSAGSAAPAPPLLTGVLAVALHAAGSSGLHLDGLADTADGLGVPGDRDRALAVMRTGDVGPLGAAALVLVLLVQAAALGGLAGRLDGLDAAVAAGLAVVVSRGCLAVACARGVPAARGDGLGSAVAGSVPPLAAAGVLAVLGLLGFVVQGGRGVGAVAVAVVVTGLVVLVARRRLGGVTGDVLGACVELALAGALVALVVGPG